MVDSQWFKLTGEMAEIADNWWQEVWQPYQAECNRVLESFKVIGADDFYYLNLVTGQQKIIGLSFSSNKVSLELKRHSQYYNCYVPNPKYLLGQKYSTLLKSIERSPIFFEPIRQQLKLPLYWVTEDPEKLVVPSFSYQQEQGCFVKIAINYAQEYIENYPDLKSVLLEETKVLHLL